MLWHLARQPDEAVLREYGPASELVIEGRAGSGFVEDASCFHRAIAPIDTASGSSCSSATAEALSPRDRS
jgi:hypothetical protein